MLATWILYHIFCLLSTVNFIFLKFFLIVCFLKTIICDSSVIIPLGVMLVNHKIQIFWIILFVGVNVLISIGMEGALATHVTFLMWTVRGKAISEFRSPNALPRAPTPLGTELVLHLRCVTLLTFVCMLRYSMWNVVPRMFLTSHYSDRIVLCQYHLTPTLLPTTQDRARIASASVLHPIDYQPWSWGLSGQLCRRVETTWAAGIGVIFKNPAV